MVDLLVHQVDGDAGDLRAPRDGVTGGVRAGERRQQRRVDVQDALRERTDDLGPQDAHVAREQDVFDALLL